MSGTGNTSIGSSTLHNNTGSSCTAFGYYSMRNGNSGDCNTAFGTQSLEDNEQGERNTAFGYKTLTRNIGNVKKDKDTGKKKTGGDMNVALGWEVLRSNVEGYRNTAAGSCALQTLKEMSFANLAIGRSAARRIEKGSYNTVIGAYALENSAESQQNTVIGYNAFPNTSNGKYNVAVGFKAHTGNYDNAVAIGCEAAAKVSNAFQLGTADNTVYTCNGYSYTSDKRDKAEIRDCTLGLDFILKLRPVDFKWNHRNAVKSSPDDRYHHGFIAQEIAAMPENFGGHQDLAKQGGEDQHTINHAEFIAPIIKAIQQRQTMIEEQKQLTRQLQYEMNEINNKLQHLG